MQDKYDVLKLENQLCFPLYACAKEIVRRYKPLLDPLGLTYTQYITMMVMWEKREISSKEMGKLLYLDSGTLTPVLKKLEEKGLVTKQRDGEDARNLIVTVTDKGMALREEAVQVPMALGACLGGARADAAQLYKLLHSLLDQLQEV